MLLGFVVSIVASRLASGRPFTAPLGCHRGAHKLALGQCIPVVGFLSQRGRCSTCGKRLPLAPPLLELAGAAVALAIYAVDGALVPFTVHVLYAAFLGLVLLVDLRHRDIYVSVITVGSLTALAGSLLLPEVGIVSAVAGAVIAGTFFLLAFLLAKLIFPHIEEPLGSGDVLLALMMGLMLGFPNVVGALLVGPLLAGAGAALMLLTRRSKLGDFIPYGVALCAAALLFLIYPAPFADALHLPALALLASELFH